MSRKAATLIGFSAILMWSLLAVLTIATAPVPPFFLNVMTFGLAGALGLVWSFATGAGGLAQVPMRVYVFGILGLFGYHALYFTAFRLGPNAQTGLIAYLWPLFIVLFSGLLPGERLGPRHILGALLAFGGAALIVLSRGEGQGGPGLALWLALGCAVTWAGYSVLSRRLGEVPTSSVTVFCLGTALLSLPMHLAFEQTAWPQSALGWLAVAALGLGPVGAAFFTWDIGMKKGDIQLLGVASYAAPLLSTLILVLAGHAQATPVLGIAAVMIAAGAWIAARPRRGADQA